MTHRATLPALALAAALAVAAATLPARGETEEERLPEAPADAPQKVVAFLTKVGVRESLETQRQEAADTHLVQMQRMVQQMHKSVPELPREAAEELAGVLQQTRADLANAYDADESLAVYAKALEEAYPGDRLDDAIQRLSTDEGRELLAAVHEAVSATQSFQLQRERRAFQRAITGYQRALRDVLARLQAQRR